MMRVVGRVLVVGVAVTGVACGPSQGKLRNPTPGEAFAESGQVSCSAVRPQSEPDLMAWDPGSRMSLNALADQGVVAVRYSANGCDVELEVLANCIGEGEYQYKPYSSTDTKVAKSAQDLYAQLPLGASRLVGKIQGDRALRTDYVLVGMATLPAGAVYPYSALKGPDCTRATHIVSRVYLGGFAMASGEAQTLQTGASVFGVGAGATRTSNNERLATEGDPAQCDRARTTGARQPLCNVPLRIGLQPLEGAPAAEGSAIEGSARRASEPEHRDEPASRSPVPRDREPPAATSETRSAGFYDTCPPLAKSPSPDYEMTASHLLISYSGASRALPEVTRSKDEARRRAKQLTTALVAGADFAELARAESDDPSRANGGDLGTFKYKHMVEPFARGVAALAPGETCTVESPFGYHIVRRR